MTALLAVVLVGPVVCAVVLVVLSRASSDLARRVAAGSVPTVAGATAVGWGLLAAASEPATWGRLVATQPVSVAAVGVAVLVVASSPRRMVGRSTAITGLSAFGVAASMRGIELPDRWLAGSIVALALLVAVGRLRDGHGRLVTSVGAVAAVAVAAGVVVDDPQNAALVSLAGVGIALAAALWSADPRPSGAVVVLPALLLAVGATVDNAPRVVDETDRVGLAGAAVGVVAALALASVRRVDGVLGRLPLAVVGAGVVVLAQDLPDARGAGLLLAAGGVAALAAGHPLGLVAALPGLTGALVVFGSASEAVHAAAGGAIIALLLAGTARAPAMPQLPDDVMHRCLLGGAVAFGVLPLWGWSGVELSDHAVGVAVAVAFALPVVVALSWIPPRRSSPVTGRIPRRRTTAVAPSHGITIHEAGSEVPPQEEGTVEEDGVEEVDGQEEGVDEGGAEAAGTTQHPVALPPQPVPGRARVRGTALRGRIRPGPGRTP
ncbi:hypothetical protein [Actinospongicola halichondriae]|uniref:hypothetical protein n=1 Tax=Actinospongicola halichondriae TaxID=3236844 RepID=UPI003D4B770D